MSTLAERSALKRLALAAGATLFREGDPGDFAYIVEAGEVELAASFEGRRAVLGSMRPGALFGELALVDGRPRSAEAVALRDSLLTVIEPEQFETRLGQSDPIVRLLLKVVMQHLRAEAARARGHHGRASPQGNAEPGPSPTPAPDGLALAALNRIRMESELRQAVTDQQLELEFQPIVELGSGRPCGMEALVRWRHPVRGRVRPDEFMGVAEETALILPIGQWVLDESLRALRWLRGRCLLPLFVSVNLAGRQTQDPGFLDHVQESLSREGLPPDALKLEIIERGLFHGDASRAWTDAALARGLKLAIDDFGTGYSSLQYLQGNRFDTLKIDRSFVWGLTTSADSASLCKAICDLAGALRIHVVAEGIETEEQARALREMGCAMGQGYHFGRPMALEAFERHLGR